MMSKEVRSYPLVLLWVVQVVQASPLDYQVTRAQQQQPEARSIEAGLGLQQHIHPDPPQFVRKD
jgi:hypothetical protein